MEFTGIIKKIYEPASGKSKTGTEWKSVDFQVQTEESHPQSICLTLLNDNCERFNLAEGQKVTVKFDARAREYNDKCYNSLIAWDITHLS